MTIRKYKMISIFSIRCSEEGRWQCFQVTGRVKLVVYCARQTRVLESIATVGFYWSFPREVLHHIFYSIFISNKYILHSWHQSTAVLPTSVQYLFLINIFFFLDIRALPCSHTTPPLLSGALGGNYIIRVWPFNSRRLQVVLRQSSAGQWCMTGCVVW